MKHQLNDQDVVCVGAQATLREVAATMRDRSIGSVVVVDDEGRAAGIVTDRDLCLRAVAWDRDPDATRVGEVMTSDLRSAPAGALHDEWSQPMRRLGVRRVPLLDDAGRPLALYAADDWLRWIAARLDEVAATADPERRHGPLREPARLLDELERHLDARQLLDRAELLEAIARLRGAMGAG